MGWRFELDILIIALRTIREIAPNRAKSGRDQHCRDRRVV